MVDTLPSTTDLQLPTQSIYLLLGNYTLVKLKRKMNKKKIIRIHNFNRFLNIKLRRESLHVPVDPLLDALSNETGSEKLCDG